MIDAPGNLPDQEQGTQKVIIGRKNTIAANGHEYVGQPFIVFATEAEADAACDMVERVSGARPMKAEGVLYQCSPTFELVKAITDLSPALSAHGRGK